MFLFFYPPFNIADIGEGAYPDQIGKPNLDRMGFGLLAPLPFPQVLLFLKKWLFTSKSVSTPLQLWRHVTMSGGCVRMQDSSGGKTARYKRVKAPNITIKKRNIHQEIAGYFNSSSVHKDYLPSHMMGMSTWNNPIISLPHSILIWICLVICLLNDYAGVGHSMMFDCSSF